MKKSEINKAVALLNKMNSVHNQYDNLRKQLSKVLSEKFPDNPDEMYVDHQAGDGMVVIWGYGNNNSFANETTLRALMSAESYEEAVEILEDSSL